MIDVFKKAPPPKRVDFDQTEDGLIVLDARGNRYEARKDGVYKQEADSTRKAVRLCDAIELVAHTRNKESDDWGLWIRFKDLDGKEHDLILSRKIFTQGRKVEEALASAGLRIDYLSGNSGKCPLAEFFNAVPPESLRRALSVDAGGYASARLDNFVFSNCTLALEGAELVRLTDPDAAAVLHEKGTLEDWQQRVSTPAKYSVRLMFGLCASFAAPLLEVVGVPSSVFHFCGRSGCGKSSILKAAASIFGGEERVLTWNATGNGLEGLAQRYNHQPLILDEIGQAKDSALSAIYDLCNGVERARKTRDAKLRKVTRWKLNVLSSGEFSLSEMKQQRARRGGEGTASGELVRLILIPADAGRGLGVLDSLPIPDANCPVGQSDDSRAAEFVNAVSSLEATGSAGRAYLMKLMSDVAERGKEEMKRRLRTEQETLEEMLAKEKAPALKGAERRVLERFAVAALAGELAIDYGVMGEAWKPGDATVAVFECFKAWRESDESPEERKAKIVSHILELSYSCSVNFQKFHFDKDTGDCIKYDEPRQKTFGTVVLGKSGDMSSLILTAYLPSQWEEVCKVYGEGLSRQEIYGELEREGVVISYNGRRNQYQLRRDLFGFPKGKWLVVLIPEPQGLSAAEDLLRRAKNA